MQTASLKLGEFLVDRKVLSKDDLEHALRKENESGVPLAKILCAEGFVNERDVAAALADQLRIPFWDPTTTPISPLVEGVIPAQLASQHMAVAVGVGADGNSLIVATDNPLDESAIAALNQATGWKIKPYLATRSDVAAAMAATYGPAAHTPGAVYTSSAGTAKPPPSM